MTKTHALTAVALLATLCALPAQAAPQKPATKAGDANAIAVVNGSPISKAMADLLIQEQADKSQPQTPALLNAVREELIVRELFAQQAAKRGLDKNAETQTRIQMARQGVLIGAYLDQYVKDHPVSEEAIQAEYKRQVDLAGPDEYKIRHILLKSEADANGIIQKLRAGEKFDALVAQSLDDNTKTAGGDLGWNRPYGFPDPAMKKAILDIKKGEYSATPARSPAGWHVFYVEDIRKIVMPPYDALKDRIRQALLQEIVKQHGAELKAAAKIQ